MVRLNADRSIRRLLEISTTLLGTERAAERLRPRPAADPNIAIDRTRPGAVLFAVGPVVCAEIREMRVRVVRRVHRSADVAQRQAEVVQRPSVDAVLNDNTESLAPRALPEIRASRPASHYRVGARAQIGLG